MSHRSGVEQCTTIAEKHVITHSLQGVFFLVLGVVVEVRHFSVLASWGEVGYLVCGWWVG
jgi:hypothetical protein